MAHVPLHQRPKSTRVGARSSSELFQTGRAHAHLARGRTQRCRADPHPHRGPQQLDRAAAGDRFIHAARHAETRAATAASNLSRRPSCPPSATRDRSRPTPAAFIRLVYPRLRGERRGFWARSLLRGQVRRHFTARSRRHHGHGHRSHAPAHRRPPTRPYPFPASRYAPSPGAASTSPHRQYPRCTTRDVTNHKLINTRPTGVLVCSCKLLHFGCVGLSHLDPASGLRWCGEPQESPRILVDRDGIQSSAPAGRRSQ